MAGDERTKAEVLDYVSSMLNQFRLMSEAHGLDMLAYLIDMAHLEARDQMSALAKISAGDQRDSAA